MILRKDLFLRIKELERENKHLQFESDGYKAIAEFYSSLSCNYDYGKFARETMKDIRKKIEKKKYKSINYHINQILKETKDSYPLYVESLFQDSYHDDTD